MALYVQKYGGTSVGTTERIEAVADKVKSFHDAGHQVVVAVSAMSGETNRLIALAKDISETPDPREMDVLVSTGEQVTIALLYTTLYKEVPVIRQLLTVTCTYTNKTVRYVT